MLDERADNRNLGRTPKVHIYPFNRVTKEGRIPQGGGRLPYSNSKPISKILNRIDLGNTEKFLTILKGVLCFS
jgi:hypothetical protein